MSCIVIHSNVCTWSVLLFLSVYADCTHSQVHYYISPSLNVHCHDHGNPCLTLAQFADNFTRLSNISNETNISLSFLPGNHSLDRELSLSHAHDFSMSKVIGGNESVFIECGSQSGRFNISETRFALIKNLHFIGCGGNRVSQVEQFKVEDTIFEGVESRGTALVLNKMIDASITKSSFLSNKRDTTFLLQNKIESNIIATLSYALDRSSPIVAGGALYTVFSNVSIVNSKFTDNTAEIGGALFVHSSSLHVVDSSFCYNGAGDMINGTIFTPEDYLHHSGGVMFISDSSCTITNSTFTNNVAVNGGVMLLAGSLFSITTSTFTDNSATSCGGVMYVPQYTAGSSFNITNSTFINNRAVFGGGVIMIFTIGSSFKIISSIFTNNSCNAELGAGGVMITFNSSFNITSSTFTNNSAGGGGVMATQNSSFNTISSTFTNNSVAFYGGVMQIFNNSSMNITDTNFTYNSATHGGVIWASDSLFNVVGSNFFANEANSSGGIMFTTHCSVHITNGIFDHNLGSLYIFSSYLNFSGYISFKNCEEPSKMVSTLRLTLFSTQIRPEGGAITSIQSIVIFTGVSDLSNNQARRGGAILATESKIIMRGETTVANNTATDSSGGGISLQQSDLKIKGNTTISGNDADRGGGIHATSSTVAVYQPFTLQLINNSAENGSGIYLEISAKLYVLKSVPGSEHLLIFQDNHASYGGAIYVDDDTNSGACSPDNECFIQTLALYQLTDHEVQFLSDSNTSKSYNNTLFLGNTASEQGANIFGGLLDRCIPSPFAEVYQQQAPPYYSGISYLGNISNMTSLKVSSLPVRICFCKSDSEPDCSYQPPTIEVKKGEAFTVPLVAVDQVNHSVEANIISSLSSQDGGFGEGQQTQSVGRNCSNVTFNVFSPHNSETISLFADGPCGNSKLSIERLHIKFTECSCPVGFQPLDSDTRCGCDCDSKLSRYITDCNSTTKIIVRTNTNAWITDISDSDSSGYVIHPNCPFVYCHPPTQSVSMNLNIPNGADAQCAYNRSGILCGGCQENLSLSLGSSRCLPCHSHWPAVLVVILLVAIVAGILLVTALLALNMTVAVGLINSFIFYANIIAANSTVFFPLSSEEGAFLDTGGFNFLQGRFSYTSSACWFDCLFTRITEECGCIDGGIPAPPPSSRYHGYSDCSPVEL